MTYPKRLIEVDLPIRRISAHARREKSIRHGHISTLHIWWARRPLAACRAVICASLWPDPADPNCPPAFREAALKHLLGFAKATQADPKLSEINDTGSWQRYSDTCAPPILPPPGTPAIRSEAQIRRRESTGEHCRADAQQIIGNSGKIQT
jgi:hypothetical protein